MCGIVGVLGKGPVAGQLVDALKRLEYRGYNSAGVATVENGTLGRRRAEGKLRNLEARLKSAPLLGNAGIGHTRWATHGKPTEANAHPHMTDDVSVVHNGIIENYRELKDELVAEGAAFTSDTDTEVIAHLITREMRAGNDPVRAVFHTLQKLEGAFALAMIFRGYNDLMIAARQGSPLAIGYGDGEMFVGSDALALAPFTDEISYLEDGDWAVLTREGVAVCDRKGNPVKRPVTRSVATALLVDKGNHRHFMIKEIHEQPEVVGHTLASMVDLSAARVDLPRLAVRLRQDRPPDHHRVRHRLLCRARRQILVRALGAAPRRRRYRLGVPLPPGRNGRGRRRAVHLPVGRDRGHARLVALLPRARPAHARHRQCARVLHRARVRRHPADPCRPRDRRRLDQGLHLPAHQSSPVSPSSPARRAAISARRWKQELVQALAEVPRHMATVLRDEKPYREAWRSLCPVPATCSISAAARATRSRSKARSS